LDFDRSPYRVANEVWSWMRLERPSVAHFHFVEPYCPLVAAARLSGARVLIHDHLALSRGDPLRVAYKRVRSLLLNRLFDERVAVSSFVARTVREVHRVPAAQVSVVDNAVEAARFEGTDAGSPGGLPAPACGRTARRSSPRRPWSSPPPRSTRASGLPRSKGWPPPGRWW